MNPMVGLQTGWVPPTPNMTWQQGMPQGLMGNVLQQASPSTGGLMSQVPSLQGNPGDWSKVAYQMAGSPNQGPYATPASLPMPAGVTNGTQSSGGSSIGGTALGLLGALAKNPSLLKSAVNGISGLFGGSSIPASVAAEGGAAADAANAASSAYAANGISGISELPSVSAAVDAAGEGASGGLMGGVSPLIADDVAATTGITGAGLGSVGVDSVSELPSVSAAVDAGAGGSGAGLGSAAGGSLAVGLALAPALYGASRKPVDYSAQWTQSAINSVQDLLKNGINESNVGQVPQLLALSDVPGLSSYTDQLRTAMNNYSNNVMNQRAAAAGFTRAQLDAAGGGAINRGGGSGGGKNRY